MRRLRKNGRVTLPEAEDIAARLEALNFEFSPEFDLQQFRRGLEVEREHWDITGGDPVATGAIALGHLREIPDYYTWLDEMERAAKKARRP